jgi:hypothetical protein
MRNAIFLFAVSFIALAASAQAQDLASGPNKGEKVPPAKVFDATGPNREKELDYVEERKDKPTVYVVVQADKFDRPVARFLKTLDGAIRSESEHAYVVAVWLTDDQDKTKEFLPRAQQSIQLINTALTCFTGEKAGPKDWGINSDAHVTVVVVNKEKVAETLGYRSINETDVPAVREAMKKALK